MILDKLNLFDKHKLFPW